VSAGRPLAGVVTVGTDHHRFDRLMDWLESWNAAHPGAVRWQVQHGSTRPLAGAEGFTMMARPQLLELLRAADVVLTQGGPGGIMDSRECGTVPIVVPRLARLDEVVDDHQVAFGRHLSRNGLLVLAESESELRAALDRAVAQPGRYHLTGAGTSDVSQAVAHFDAAVSRLLASRPARRGRRGTRQTANR